MGDIADAVKDAVDQAKEKESRLNSFVAMSVAVAATFMALCNVKDGNIVQTMQAAQAEAVDQWAFFQAKSTKQNLAEQMVDDLQMQLLLAGPSATPEVRKIYQDKIAAYQAKVADYDAEKGKIREKAEGLKEKYDALNVHDDQFDLAEASLSVSIALFGVTALTQKKWMLYFGLGVATFGLFFGLCGFLKLPIHLDFLANLLG